MEISEARLAANKLNASLSKGPTSPEGRSNSSRNSLKHGLTGRGAVLPEGDAEEVARRAEALTDDMKPRSAAGAILIGQMALLSVRMERAAEQVRASTAYRVRHAEEDFEDEQVERAKQLLATIADDPRDVLRKLRRSPEGVRRLIHAWQDLRADLAIVHKLSSWEESHLEKAANLMGVKLDHARGTRLGALARGLWGYFEGLGEDDGGGLDRTARMAWSKARLFEFIDAQIEALEAHRLTLDPERIELDRAEAASRALFDPSKEATLARRYESEARRGFFKALKEFHEVEADFAALQEPVSTPAVSPEPLETGPRMGSSRETLPPPTREPAAALPTAPKVVNSVARLPELPPNRLGRAVKLPG